MSKEGTYPESGTLFGGGPRLPDAIRRAGVLELIGKCQ